LSALEKANGHRADAARLLGISERTLYRYVQKLRVTWPDEGDNIFTSEAEAG
jgi:DNA-binding NtrC family response regulator